MSKSTAKETAWRWFSKFIRARDCLLTTGTIEEGDCISCGRRYTFERLQAGHFVPGRSNSVLFDEDGVNAQCVRCNKFLSGNYEKYEKRLLRKIGSKRLALVKAQAGIILKLAEEDYRQIADVYRKKYKELVENPSLADQYKSLDHG